MVLFYKNYKYAIKDIRYALEQGNLKEAQMLVHTIKGAAGNLSAQAVYQEASALEAEFRGNRFDDVELLLEQLEQVLEQTCTSISLIETDDEYTQSSELGIVDITPLKPILEKLEKLLQDNNMAAMECIEEIAGESKDTAFDEKAADMRKYIDEYDFESALVILNKILNSIGGESEDE